MKKLLATFVTLIVLSMTALPVAAQTRSRWTNRSTNNGRTTTRNYGRSDSAGRYRNDAYRTNSYYDNNYRYGQDRSFWEEHRDKITTAGGAAGGAVLGGLIGGKKGAIIGAITGGVGAAVYTYKIRDKNHRY